MRENYPPKVNGRFVATQYCPQGHDKNIVGRTSTKACKLCSLLKSRSIKARRSVRERVWDDTGLKNKAGYPFGFTDYDRLYAIQKGCCEICGKHQSGLNRALCADHNHETGIVRGLLCVYCNHAVGIVEGPLMNKIKRYLGDL